MGQEDLKRRGCRGGSAGSSDKSIISLAKRTVTLQVVSWVALSHFVSMAVTTRPTEIRFLEIKSVADHPGRTYGPLRTKAARSSACRIARSSVR